MNIFQKSYKHHFLSIFLCTVGFYQSFGQDNFETTVNTFPRKTNLMIEGEFIRSGDKITLEQGDHDIVIVRKGFHTYRGTLTIDENKPINQHNFLIEPLKYRKKGMALLASVILPGMGARYLRRDGYGPVLGMAGYSLLLGSMNLHNRAAKTYDEYLLETDREMRYQLNDQWQKEKQQSEILLIGAGTVWLSGFIWTLLIENEEDYFARIKLEMSFDNINQQKAFSFILPLNRID